MGTILWRYPFGSEFKTNCASPVWSDDILFVSAAYGTGFAPHWPLVKNSGGWEVKEKKWKDKKTHADSARHQHGHGQENLRCQR